MSATVILDRLGRRPSEIELLGGSLLNTKIKNQKQQKQK